MFVDLDSTKSERFPFRMSTVNASGETVWGDPVEGVWVEIRSWRTFFEEAIMNQVDDVEWKVNPQSRQMQRHVNPKILTPEEKKKQRDDSIDYAITAWGGWRDKKSRNPIECTRENKLAMMRKDFFDRFFTDCMQKIDAASVEVEKAKTKN